MRLSVLSILVFLTGTCFAQVPTVQIQKENNHFYVNDKLIGNLNYIITNNDNVATWLWFSENNTSSLDDYQKVKQYFKLPSPKGEGSLYQWMCDGNVDIFTESIFLSFVKVIQPNERFRVSFTYQNTDVTNMMSIIDTHLNLVSEKEIIRQCPGIEIEPVKKQFIFHSSIITIPWDYFWGQVLP